VTTNQQLDISSLMNSMVMLMVVVMMMRVMTKVMAEPAKPIGPEMIPPGKAEPGYRRLTWEEVGAKRRAWEQSARFTEGQAITIKSKAIYQWRTWVTVKRDDPEHNQVWVEEIAQAVKYEDVEEEGSIHGPEREELVKQYGTWAVGRAESVCPEDDVECVRREAARLLQAYRGG